MNLKKTIQTGASAALLSVTALFTPLPATAAQDGDDQLGERIKQLEKEVAELKQKKEQDWLSQRQSEEVRGIIQDMLDDAEKRRSLEGAAIIAGHDGSHFFLTNDTGSFLLEIAGQAQFRYILQHQEDRTDATDSGFQFRRAKLNFSGQVEWGRVWEYDLTLATQRDSDEAAQTVVTSVTQNPITGVVTSTSTVVTYSTAGDGAGDVFLEEWKIGTPIEAIEGLKIEFGKFKVPFLREEMTSSKRQLTVERSSVNEFFTANRSEQIQLVYTGKQPREWRVKASLHDGANEEFSDYHRDAVIFGVAGRIDIALAGKLKQADDFTAWDGEDFAAFIGAGILYQAGDDKNAGVLGSAGMGSANYTGWTIDGSVEVNRFNLFAAVMGGHIDPHGGVGGTRDMYGALVQGGYQIIANTLEPFARFEYIHDDVGGKALDAYLVTVGANYYFKKHNAKFTADVVVLVEGDDPTGNPFGASEFSSGLGLTGINNAGTDVPFAVRLQFQLLF